MTSAPVPFLCMLSTARSGTNHLCRLLQCLSGISVNLEIFHGNGPTHCGPALLDGFQEAAGQVFAPMGDPALKHWIHDNLPEALQVLRASAEPGSRAVSVKIFQDHLPRDVIEEQFGRANDTRFLIVRRRPIDTYISYQKALHTQAWILKETTDIRPALDVQDFLDWHSNRSDWFAFVDAMVARHGRPSVGVNYEDDILTTDAATLRQLRTKLRSLGLKTQVRSELRLKQPIKRVIARVATGVGVTSPWDANLGYVRQDRNSSAPDKVSNWPAFHASLADLGALDHLERFASE